MQISFTLFAVPRTKKNSANIVSFGAKCEHCGERPHSKLVPSEQFTQFESVVLLSGTEIRGAIERTGKVKLPLIMPVSIKALIYREIDAGDWNGYTDAIADVLQQPLWYVPCPKCKRRKKVGMNEIRLAASVVCGEPKCRTQFRVIAAYATEARRGLGIIADDCQVRDWDGTRLTKDATDPRIEITITTVDTDSLKTIARSLFDGESEA